ncbi:MAG: hypothetical protein Faunusvirus58_4, partial [Faunusvirus sp.]
RNSMYGRPQLSGSQLAAPTDADMQRSYAQVYRQAQCARELFPRHTSSSSASSAPRCPNAPRKLKLDLRR